MSNYTKTTNFASKDNLSPGNPLKIVKGAEIDTEYNNIATAIATKTDNSSANITGGSITGITDLAIADGGTGASTATAALNNLLPSQTGNATKYLQTDGTNATWDAVSLSTSDITGTLPVANGGTGVTSSTGTGSVVLSNSPTLVTPALGTPASGTATNLTGLPISTGVSGLGTGVATFLGTPSSANLASAVTDETGSGALVFANSPTLVTPTLGTPASATLTNATGLPISTGVSGLGTGVASFLATPSSANLATAVSDETGSGALVFANSPTLVTPALGTPSSGTLTNATGLPIATGVSGLGTGVATALAVNIGSAGAPLVNGGVLGTPSSGTATNLTGLPLSTGVIGTLPVANGGTGQTSYTDGQLLIGNTTGNTLSKATLTAGSNITITNGNGSITIASTASGSGDVVGPASSTDNAFARFDSTTGKLLQNSTGATLSDTGGATFTGSVDVAGTSTAGSNIKLYEDTDNGTNYVAFKAPDTIAANVTWTLPAADGTSSQVLSTNGSGTLSWATAGSGSPGGSTTQVQYNNAGSFAGSSNFNFDGSRVLLGLTSSLSGARLQVQGATDTAFTALTVNASTNDAFMGIGYNSSGSVWQIFPSYQTTAGYKPLAFMVGGSEVARFPTASGFQCVNSISVGNATPTTSGAGITFPATQSASSDANTLDDYEEGSWTPAYSPASGSFGSIGYGARGGRYTKIGNTVNVWFIIQVTSFSVGTASGQLTITGLPFSVNSSANNRGSGAVSNCNSFTSGNNPETLWGSGTTLYPYKRTSAGGAQTISQVSDIATNCEFACGYSYEIA